MLLLQRKATSTSLCAFTDYGHDDVFQALDAEQRVFEQVLDLVRNH